MQTVTSRSTPPVSKEMEARHTEDMAEATLTDEDAHSLLGFSMSATATRMKAPETPALEKHAAMQEGEYFESDPESPRENTPGQDPSQNNYSVQQVCNEGHPRLQAKKLSFGKLPSPGVDLAHPLPTPWHAGPRPFVIHNKDGTPQNALHGAFSNTRTRSLSGGAEALKKFLPKALPSVGNLFGSSGVSQKTKTDTIPTHAQQSQHHVGSSDSGFSRSPASSHHASHQAYQLAITSRPSPSQQGGPPTPKELKHVRRVTSDDSLLYHSLSRASSLGDDARFEDQREMVNSRAKAIRDSLQDRSSFRLPQMPSMPRVPSFNFNVNFLNSDYIPVRWRPDADPMSDMLPGINKKRLSVVQHAEASGMMGAAVGEPEAVIANAQLGREVSTYNHLDRALKHLTGDVVVMGGYRGSVLRSSKTGRQVWVPVKVGLNIRKVNLEVGLEPEDEEHMSESIYASGMLRNIGPVDISKRLFKRLADSENAQDGTLRIWDYGYDWRLSPHLLSQQLTQFLEKLPSNQKAMNDTPNESRGALIIAHSLGGLITRHVVNRRPELFSGVIYAGVPQACVNILGPLRNGDAVLLSSRVLTAQVNFTLRTSFVLLPEDGHCFIDLNTKEKYPVNFFDVNDWIRYRWSPCTDPPLPPRNQVPSGGLGNILSGSISSLPLPGMKTILGSSTSRDSSPGPKDPTSSMAAARAVDTIRGTEGGTDRTLAPQMGSVTNPVSKGQSTNQSVSTTVTIRRDRAIRYLERTLRDTKVFKSELHHRPELSQSNSYPPLALIYGKSIPTVYGAKVDGREGIACSDSYDNLAFASGDGVCLAKEAMLPEGYKAVNGGRISSDRGHVTLLGDLNAVGRAIEAVVKGRAKGIGLGV